MIRREFSLEKPPQPIEEFRYEELVAMIDVVSEPDTDEEVAEYYEELIELSLPGAGVADLILWPSEWFGDKKMEEVDLSSREIAKYLLAWTGIRLLGSEHLELPEIPESKPAAHKRPARSK